MAAIGSTSVSTILGITQPVVANVALTAANTEVSHLLPANTKAFFVECRQFATLKLSFAVGTSGTVYRTIRPGTFFSLDGLTGATATLYLQSSTPNVIAEIVSGS